jgi:hypothetical protein
MNSCIISNCKASSYSTSSQNVFGGGIFLIGFGNYDGLINEIDFQGLKIYNNSASDGG